MRLSAIALAGSLFLTLCAVPAPAVPVGTTAEETRLLTLSPVMRKVLPSVVTIRSQLQPRPEEMDALRSLFPFLFGGQADAPQEELRATGAGFMIDSRRGLIVTNSHVVEGAEQIAVTLFDGAKVSATVLGADPATDVAVLKIEEANVPALAFADSDTLEVGDFVISVGNPFGIGVSATTGIVSALHRTQLGLVRYDDFIQTDANTNIGDSGGPLVDSDGHVVGVISATLEHKDQNSGFGFAIPANLAQAVVAQILAHGDIKRGQIGVTARDLADSPRARQLRATGTLMGAELASVEAGSVAAAAGLVSGDVILAFDGRPIRNAADFRNQLALTREGARVNLSAARGERIFAASVVLQPVVPKLLEGEALNGLLAGVVFQFVPAVVPADVPEIEVASLTPEGRAAKAGIRAGDVVASVNDQLVDGPEDFSALLKGKERRLLLGLVRNGRRVFILIE
jgi:S1-C subfamily serine protease